MRLTAALSCAGAAALAAFVPISAQQPSFRAGVQLVEVHALVTDARGRPIRDLAAADFEILEDGRPQTINEFSLVDIPLTQPADATGALESDIATNVQATEGRLWILLLDAPAALLQEATLAYTVRTQNVARQLLDEVMGPDDLVAVIHVQGSMASSQPLTRSKALARRSIDRFVTGPGLNAQTEQEAVAMMRNTFRIIEELAASSGAMTVRRKALIWIGGQIYFDPASAGGSVAGATGTLLAAYRDAMRAAQRNHVAIYPVDPTGLPAESLVGPREKRIVRQAALRMVAEDTGGYPVINTNEFSRGFGRILEENSSYYLLGYSPPVQHTDGEFHEITVRVRRPGVTVRARRGYYAPVAKAEAPAPVSSAAEALRNPIPATGIRLAVFAAAFKGAETRGRVLVGAHLRGEDLRVGEHLLEVAYQVIDDEGRTVITRGVQYTLPTDGARRATIERDGLRLLHELELRRGRFEIRYAVSQPGGAAGSVVTFVDVPNFTAGRISMSGLLVEVRGPGAPPRAASTAALSAEIDPTPIRHVPETATLTAAGVVYADSSIPDDAIAFEPSILDAAGATVRDASSGLVVHHRIAAAGERHVTVEVPLKGLRPGRHVFKLAARATRGRQAVAERILSFWIVDERVPR